MTDEQAKQYEICKVRRHEAVALIKSTQNARMMAQAHEMGPFWNVCRWCGAQFRDIEETHTRQIERVDRG